MLTTENTRVRIAIQDLDEFTAIEAAMNYTHIWNEHIDWHEFSSLFDLMRAKRELVLVGHNNSGMCIYRWEGAHK